MARTIRQQLVHPISIRRLQVIDAVDLTPGMRRVVLGGDELNEHNRDGYRIPPFVSAGFDDDIKIFFPDPTTGVLSLPLQRNRFLDWPTDPPALSRTYTVRSYDQLAGEVTVDFVTHGTGLATSWAQRCSTGDEVHIAGPKMAWLQPEGVSWLLIAGDETALPAIGRWVEEMAADTRAQIFVEVQGPDQEQKLALPTGVELHWVHRGSVPPGTGARLLDAMRSAPWPGDDVFAWVAGEALTLKPIRRYLREYRGLPADRVEITGYWRHHAVVALPDDPGLPDISDEEAGDSERFHEMVDLLPPYAIRVAATLNLVPLLLSGYTTARSLATAAGVDPTALAKLLRYLVAIGLLRTEENSDPIRYAVTPLGAELDDEDAVALDLDHPLARLDGAFSGLLDAVRTGGAAYHATFGATLDEQRESDPATDRAIGTALSDELIWIAAAVGTELMLPPRAHVAAAGDAAPVLLNALMRRDPGLRVTLVARPSREAALLDRFDDDVRGRVHVRHGSEFDGWPSDADVLLIAGLLGQYPDIDAVHLIRQARRATAGHGEVIVIEPLMGTDAIDDHDAGDDLRMLCIFGSGLRTKDELRSLFDLAGAGDVTEQVIGWGDSIFRLGGAGPDLLDGVSVDRPPMG